MAMTEGEIAAEQGLMAGDFRAAQQEDLAMQNPENANMDFSGMMGGMPPNDPMAQEAMMMNMQQNPEEPVEGMPRPDDYGMGEEEIPPELMQQMMMEQGQMQPQEPPNPAEVLPDVILTYMDYTIGVANDETLNHVTKSDILSKMATAMNSLVPLLNDTQQTDLMMKQAEMQMKQEEQQMDFQLKQQEHQMNMEMKQIEMQMKMEEHRMKLQMQQEQNQQKLEQQEIQNQQKIVQSQEAHKTKIEQQKQAAQLKHSNKDVSN